MKKINVFGRDIKVIYKSGLRREHEADGIYYSDKMEIHIDADLSSRQRLETLIHEAGHALFHRAGLGQSEIIADLEEIIVEQFCIMFSENFLPKKKTRLGKK